MSGEQRQLDSDDLDLCKEGSTITLALKQRLLQTCLFLQDTFSLVLVESLRQQMPHSGQSRQDDLSRQLWFLLLNTDFAILQQLPFLTQTLALCDDRLHLHLQFDAFAPEKLSSSLLRISWLLPVLSRLSMLVVLLMLMLRSLLVTHEGTFLLFWKCRAQTSGQQKRRQNQLLMDWFGFACLLSVTRLSVLQTLSGR